MKNKQPAKGVPMNPPKVEAELIRWSEENCDLPAIAKWQKERDKTVLGPDKETIKKHLDEGPGLV
jgi:hypothetical protein